MEPGGPTASFVMNYLSEDMNDPSRLMYLQNQDQTETPTESRTESSVIAWNQLINCYASSSDDLQEVHTLLSSWNLVDLYHFFVCKYCLKL